MLDGDLRRPDPHLLRHAHRTWMTEDRIPEVLAHERLGHEMGGIAARYTHVTDAMRAELVEALTERWNSALDARLRMHPHSPAAVLDELLTARAAKKRRGRPQDRPTGFPRPPGRGTSVEAQKAGPTCGGAEGI